MKTPIPRWIFAPVFLCLSVVLPSKYAVGACGNMADNAAFFIGSAAFNEFRPQLRDAFSNLFRAMVNDPKARIEMSEEHPYEVAATPSIEQVNDLLTKAIEAEPNPKIKAVLTRYRDLSIEQARAANMDVTSKDESDDYVNPDLNDQVELAHQLNQFDGYVGREDEMNDLETQLRDLLKEIQSAMKERESMEPPHEHNDSTPHQHNEPTRDVKRGGTV